jgi:hypothetical protein
MVFELFNLLEQLKDSETESSLSLHSPQETHSVVGHRTVYRRFQLTGAQLAIFWLYGQIQLELNCTPRSAPGRCWQSSEESTSTLSSCSRCKDFGCRYSFNKLQETLNTWLGNGLGGDDFAQLWAIMFWS